ncbi:MAG TPA: HAMP domain-containing sensor histidine kinase, partial [Candidatus Kapabacteria bacterium]|nr:HAMP domain-containing sensor histidine kinase [Candidatus Kapabacteria bacterium]
VEERELKCNIEIALYRHQIEAELLRKKEMEAIGKFSVGIVHDFNNLLQGIIGCVDVAAAKCSTVGCESGGLPFLKKSLQHLQKAADLIKQYQHIFNIYQYDLLAKDRVTVPDILNRIKSAVDKIQVEKKIKISYCIEEAKRNDVSLNGDAARLEEVFVHLINNAVEAMDGKEENVPVTISVNHVPVEPENEWLLKPGPYIKISICDQGKGIPGEDINKLFIPYFSTKEEYTRKGLGLGMTICYSIIKQHEGHIDIQSEEGKGTTVAVFLPVS